VSTTQFEGILALLKDTFLELEQVKVNYVDICLLAMEDFIAHADRNCIGRSILRQRGSLARSSRSDLKTHAVDSALQAWNSANEECVPSWKYRQVRCGEWKTMESLGNSLQAVQPRAAAFRQG
jgi:hypothetical protein